MRTSTLLPLLILGAAATPINPLLPREYICSGFHFNSGKASTDSDLWMLAGVGDFLDKFGEWYNGLDKQVLSTRSCWRYPARMKGVFNGDLPDVSAAEKVLNSMSSTIGLGGVLKSDAKAQFISNTFKDGALVDQKLVDPLVDQWNTKAAGFMVGQ
jgi:hypothetical protein